MFLFQFSITSPSPGTHSGWKPRPWTSSAHWDGWTCSLSQEQLQGPVPHTWKKHWQFVTREWSANISPDALKGSFQFTSVVNKSGDMWTEALTKWVSCWPPLWGNVAGRNRSSPCSCAPPGTRPAQRWHTSLPPLWPDQTGMEISEGGGRRISRRRKNKIASVSFQNPLCMTCSDREKGLNTCSSRMMAMSLSSFCCCLSLASS